MQDKTLATNAAELEAISELQPILHFIAAEHEDRHHQDVWSTIGKTLPAIAQQAYDAMDAHPQMRELFALDQVSATQATSAHCAHWQALCSGPVTEELKRKRLEIAASRATKSCSRSWFMAAQARLMVDMIPALVMENKRRPHKLAEQLQAFVALSFIDMIGMMEAREIVTGEVRCDETRANDALQNLKDLADSVVEINEIVADMALCRATRNEPRKMARPFRLR